MMTDSGVNKALMMSLDDVIELQQRRDGDKFRRSKFDVERNNGQASPSTNPGTSVSAVNLKVDSVRRKITIDWNEGNEGNGGEDNVRPTVQFDPNSIREVEFRNQHRFNGNSHLQRQQRFPQNHSNGFQRRNVNFRKHFNQIDMSHQLIRQDSQNGCCCDYEGGSFYGQLRRAPSNSSLLSDASSFGGGCSFNAHGPVQHMSRSILRGPPRGRGGFSNRSRSRSAWRAQSRSPSRSRSRASSRSQSPPRSRSQPCSCRGRSNGVNHFVLTRKSQILDAVIQKEIAKMQATSPNKFASPHGGVDIQPPAKTTGMSIHDRFGSYYAD